MKTAPTELRLSPIRLPDALASPVLQADGAVAGPVAVVPPFVVGVANLLTRQVLRDGEIVILILKPSRWSILLNSLRWTAAILIAAIWLHLANPRFTHIYVEAAAFAVAARITWATLRWMGRLYVLTDQRIVKISGVYTVDVFECSLRKVARTRLACSFRERLMGLGTIEILPQDESRPCAMWRSVRQPREVQEQIQRAIRRAKQGGCFW